MEQATDVEQAYYVPGKSPKQDWTPSSDLVNRLSAQDVILLAKYWISNDPLLVKVKVSERPDLADPSVSGPNTPFYKDSAVPNKKVGGHPQLSVPVELRSKLSPEAVKMIWDETKSPRKLLRHQVMWRYINNSPLVKGLEISHQDADPKILRLIAESHFLNETRKPCHLYPWWVCNHFYSPCSRPRLSSSGVLVNPRMQLAARDLKNKLLGQIRKRNLGLKKTKK